MTATSVWPRLPLKALSDNFDSLRRPVKEADRVSGPYPYYGASGVVDSVDDYLFDGEYLLVAEDGENLKSRKLPIAFLATGKFWVNNHAHILRANQNSDTRFLMYALSQAEIDAYLTGSTMPKLTQQNLSRIPIIAPPLSEQRAIAHIVGTLDDKIELNRRMNQTLEEMARALFHSWFVTFDPVRDKAAGRQPAGMDAATAALFPDSFEWTEDDDYLPSGWTMRRLDELASINQWSLGKQDELDLIEYVEISEVSRGDIGHVTVYGRGTEPSRARRRLRHGDTVLSTVRPDRGSYFLALDPSPNLIASTGFAVLSPQCEPWSFVYCAATQPEVFRYLGRLADGGAYPAVRPDVIGAWQVAMPQRAELIDRFAAVVSPLFERMESNRRESRTLATIRDALLPKLLSGEVRVGELGVNAAHAVGVST